MNHQFDELTKGMAQSVTRRVALKKLGIGLAGMALACFGLANKAEASHFKKCFDKCKADCLAQGYALTTCQSSCGLLCGQFP